MKIAIIGSGGREHALSWKLAQTLGIDNVYTLPGNGGIPNSHSVDTDNFDAVKTFCEQHQIGYIFVGPEVPLSNGMVDYFNQTTIKAFGPCKDAALLEGSKIFSKKFMKKYGVATSPFETFSRISDAAATVQKMQGNLVIKYDGLAAGKGVFVCSNIDQATKALEEMSQTYGAECPFLIEEKIVGDEISIIGFTDGKNIKLLLPSQDHKQLNDGDTGPNTGGMGVICPVPFWSEALAQEIENKIVAPTLKGIQAEKMNYKGMIYFGIMMGAKGAELLEYNARFGDPETEVLLPSLKTDLMEVVKACLNGTLAEVNLEFNEGYFVDVVQVSGGYPKEYQKGYEIQGLDKVEGAMVFHAGTKLQDGKVVTSGGRVLNIVAQGKTLQEAIDKAYLECGKVSFKDNFYRKDIGKRELKVAQLTLPMLEGYCQAHGIVTQNKTKNILIKEVNEYLQKEKIKKAIKDGKAEILLLEQIENIAQKYAENLDSKIQERKEEMKSDDTSHYLIYRALGISSKDGQLIDEYQNTGRFLYKYAGAFLEETASLCLEFKNLAGGKKVINNNQGSKPKTFEIDFLDGQNAIEIKWRDATTDGDHITKEHARVKCIESYGYKPIRLMFYEPQRTQAKNIQATLKTIYIGVKGEYYSGEAAWSFIKTYTGYDLKSILTVIADKKTLGNED